MAQSSQRSSAYGRRRGYIWVWLADGLGLTIAICLVAAAAGAPALKHLASWLIMALPFAGLAMAVVGDRRLLPQRPQQDGDPARLIVITPRPNEARSWSKRLLNS